MVVPALALGYLVAAPARLGRRLGHLGVAGRGHAGRLAVLDRAVHLYPGGDRPWVDGSTNNSAIAMVFGYNGVERFGISVPGAVALRRRGSPRPGTWAPSDLAGGQRVRAPPRPAARSSASTLARQLRQLRRGPSWCGTRRTARRSAGCTRSRPAGAGLRPGWTRRAARTDQVRAGFVMWGAWLLTFGVMFSGMSTIPHTAYVASLAPPLAALSARRDRDVLAGVPGGWLARLAAAGRGRGRAGLGAVPMEGLRRLPAVGSGRDRRRRGGRARAADSRLAVHARSGPAGDGRADRRRRGHARGTRRLGGLRARHQIRRHLVERERRPG